VGYGVPAAPAFQNVRCLTSFGIVIENENAVLALQQPIREESVLPKLPNARCQCLLLQ
jgi:hypothetical protein